MYTAPYERSPYRTRICLILKKLMFLGNDHFCYISDKHGTFWPANYFYHWSFNTALSVNLTCVSFLPVVYDLLWGFSAGDRRPHRKGSFSGSCCRRRNRLGAIYWLLVERWSTQIIHLSRRCVLLKYCARVNCAFRDNCLRFLHKQGKHLAVYLFLHLRW